MDERHSHVLLEIVRIVKDVSLDDAEVVEDSQFWAGQTGQDSFTAKRNDRKNKPVYASPAMQMGWPKSEVVVNSLGELVPDGVGIKSANLRAAGFGFRFVGLIKGGKEFGAGK